jgi:hypothetical protein
MHKGLGVRDCCMHTHNSAAPCWVYLMMGVPIDLHVATAVTRGAEVAWLLCSRLMQPLTFK